ncbi:uncharacterized protein LOC144620060 [Crassostrea virginica]
MLSHRDAISLLPRPKEMIAPGPQDHFLSFCCGRCLRNYIKHLVRVSDTEALVSKSFTPKKSSGSGNMSSIEMVTVSDTLKAQGSNFIQPLQRFEGAPMSKP